MIYWCKHYTMVISYDSGYTVNTLTTVKYDVWSYPLGIGVAEVVYN